MPITDNQLQLALYFPPRDQHLVAEGSIISPSLHPIDRFSGLSLADMAAASLLDRQETKYICRKDRIFPLLAGLESDYLVLEIQGRRHFDYRSIYFDTEERLFYQQHHAGALPRCKIRQRIYLQSRACYLEIKHKDNRGKTHKSRRQIDCPTGHLSQADRSFLAACYPHSSAGLAPVLETRYTRTTLVRKDSKERITVDSGMRFSDGESFHSLSNLAAVEIKQDRYDPRSPFMIQMKEGGVRPGRFSKYCLGSVLLDPNLKHNRFKPILHRINSLREGGTSHEWAL